MFNLLYILKKGLTQFESLCKLHKPEMKLNDESINMEINFKKVAISYNHTDCMSGEILIECLGEYCRQNSERTLNFEYVKVLNNAYKSVCERPLGFYLKQIFDEAFKANNGNGLTKNESFMRAISIALLTSKKSLLETSISTIIATAITHANHSVIISNIILAIVIRTSFNIDNQDLLNNPTTLCNFSSNLIIKLIKWAEKMEKLLEVLEYEASDDPSIELNESNKSSILKLSKYHEKRKKDSIISNRLFGIGEILENEKRMKFTSDFYHDLINSTNEASEEIPAAIFSFLVGINKLYRQEVNKRLRLKKLMQDYDDAFEMYTPTERAVMYALTFNNNGVNVARVTCAICGAFFGPNEFKKLNVDLKDYQDVYGFFNAPARKKPINLNQDISN